MNRKAYIFALLFVILGGISAACHVGPAPLPTTLFGNIRAVTEEHLIVVSDELSEDGEYRITFAPGLLILAPDPDNSLPIGAAVTISGHFDHLNRTGLAERIWVNFVRAIGPVTDYSPTADGLVFVVEDRQGAISVQLAHDPTVPVLIGIGRKRQQNLDQIDLSKVIEASVYGLQNADGLVIPLTIQLAMPLANQPQETTTHIPEPTLELLPSSLPTPTVADSPVVIGGEVLATSENQILVATAGGIVAAGQYTITLTESTYIEKAYPDHPIQVGERVTIVGSVDEPAKTGAATHSSVNAIRIFGTIVGIITDEEGVRLAARNPFTGEIHRVHILHDPPYEQFLEFHFLEISDTTAIPWQEIDAVEVFGYLGTNGVVTPGRVIFSSEHFRIPPYR